MQVQLTSREAADLLAVHESTVKRWCNARELPYTTTRGGHRRIDLEELMLFARSQQLDSPMHDFRPYQPQVWMAVKAARDKGDFQPLSALALEWALGDQPHLIEAMFRYLGTIEGIRTARIFDELLGTMMRSVGDAWRKGQIGVGEEHFSTQVVLDALHQLRSQIHAGHPVYRDPARRHQLSRAAIVACAEGEQHELGAMCVRILLEQSNWRVYYLGANVPIEEIAAFQKKQRAELVAISFVPPRAPSDVQRTIRLLGEMYDPRTPCALALGGGGLGGSSPPATATPFLDLVAFDRLTPFESWLKSFFSDHRPGGQSA